MIDKVNKNIEVAASVASICFNFFRDLYGIFQFSLITIGTTSVILAIGAAIFAIGVALFIWITSTDIFWQVENSKNEEIKKWVEDAKNGIIKKYKFVFKRVGHSTDGSTADFRKVILRKWTDYASSIEEFKNLFRYVGFTDSLAQAGGQGTTVEKGNILIPTVVFNDCQSLFPIVNYYYNLLFTEQTAKIYCYNYLELDEEYLTIIFCFRTYSYLAINDVWASLRFNDAYFTL